MSKRKKEKRSYKKERKKKRSWSTTTLDSKESWDSGIDDEICPALRDELTASLIIPPEIWNVIQELTEEINSEWLGYLKGDFLNDGFVLNVKEIIIPEQEVTGVSVTVKEDIDDVQGVVHSHSNMGVFFSGTDDNYINTNNAFSLVVNKDGKHKAIARIKLNCGFYIRKECNVEILRNVSKKFIKKALKKIKKKKYKYNDVWGFKEQKHHLLFSRDDDDNDDNNKKKIDDEKDDIDEEKRAWNWLKDNEDMWNNE